MSRTWLLKAAFAIGRRPALLPTAVAQLFHLAPNGWWRQRPYLPLPDPAYLRFRLQTQYGDEREPEPSDVVEYLEWCRGYRRLAG